LVVPQPLFLEAAIMLTRWLSEKRSAHSALKLQMLPHDSSRRLVEIPLFGFAMKTARK
jgi:hypothetical protein